MTSALLAGRTETSHDHGLRGTRAAGAAGAAGAAEEPGRHRALRTCVVTARGAPGRPRAAWPASTPGRTLTVDVSPARFEAEDVVRAASAAGFGVTLVDRAALGHRVGPPAWALAATDEDRLLSVLDLLAAGAPTTSVLVVGVDDATARVGHLLRGRSSLRRAHLTDASQGWLRMRSGATTRPGVVELDPLAPGSGRRWDQLLVVLSQDPWVDLVVVAVERPDQAPDVLCAGCAAGRDQRARDRSGLTRAPVVVLVPGSRQSSPEEARRSATSSRARRPVRRGSHPAGDPCVGSHPARLQRRVPLSSGGRAGAVPRSPGPGPARAASARRRCRATARPVARPGRER